ncbi:MAG TPA: hypothetical protein VFO97_05595 [Desertimonas sp.]|nr:hypothetical protein [Desertimonas sp.]
MSDVQVVIERRFRGPPNSVNGGYACGVAASALGIGTIEVTLHAPPPLERPVSITVDGGEARLVDGHTTVAVARRSSVEIEVPPPVPYNTARSAADAFDVAAYRSVHEFPECFVCGPDRSEGDGLRILSAPSGDARMRIWPWIPHDSLFEHGALDVRLVWAALDCPGGLAGLLAGDDAPPAVLGRLTATVNRRPEPGEPLVVAGWTGARQGRKTEAGTAIWSASGEVLAAGRATWIDLTPGQREAFAGTGTAA